MLFAAAAPVFADADSDSLLRLVGADVGMCVEGRQLREHFPAFRESDFFERVQKSSLYQQWLTGNDYQKLLAVKSAVEKLTEKPFGQFLSELFGEEAVLAVYPGENGKHGAVLLTKAADADVLASALAAWNRADQHETAAIKYAGQTYYRRTKLDKARQPVKTVYYVVAGRILALSEREALIRQVIDLRQSAAAAPGADPVDAAAEVPVSRRAVNAVGPASLLDSAVYQKARRSLSANVVVSVYVNPRVWQNTQQDDADTPVARHPLAELWRRCESLIGGLQLDQGVVGEVIAQLDAAETPEPWQRLLEGTAGAAEFIGKAPRHALLAVVGRQDWKALAELLIEPLPEEKRSRFESARQVARGLLLGLDVFDDVLPSLKPNWTVYFVPRQQLVADAPPVDALLAFELPAERAESTKSTEPDAAARENKPTLRSALDNALLTGLNLLVASHNAKQPNGPAVVRLQESEGRKLRWAENLGPFTPGYALSADALVVASSRSLIDEFLTADATEALSSSAAFRRSSQLYFRDANQIVFFNIAGVRDFVTDNREFFVRQAARSEEVTEEAAEARVSRLEDVLGLFDAAFIAVRARRDHIRLTLGGLAGPK